MPKTLNSAAPAKRPRGRPPRISEAVIVEKTLELLASRNADEISMALVAEHLGIPTMSLYNYFPNNAALLNAVSDYAFSLFKFPQSHLRKSWQQATLAWLWAVQNHFDRHPLAMKILMVEGQSAPAWVKAMTPLLRILKGAGLSGERLTFAMCWLTSQAVGVMAVEGFAHQSRQVFAQRELSPELDSDEQKDHAELKKYVKKIRRDDVLEFSFQAIIRALGELIDKH